MNIFCSVAYRLFVENKINRITSNLKDLEIKLSELRVRGDDGVPFSMKGKTHSEMIESYEIEILLLEGRLFYLLSEYSTYT